MSGSKEINIRIPPYVQVVLIITVMVIFIGGGVFMESMGWSRKDPIFPWTVSASMLLLYALFNCALSLNAEDSNKYWLHSLICYVVLVISGGLIAYLFTGISIYEAKSVKWLYVVFTFGYLVFLSIVNTMRIIVRLAKKEDSNLRGGD